jgi:hypothetical protein
MTAGLAASGLVVLMLGAAWTHISSNEGFVAALPLVFAALAAVVAYLRWPLRPRE